MSASFLGVRGPFVKRKSVRFRKGEDGASGLLHIHPLLGLGGFEHCVTDILGAERVSEIWVAFFGAWLVERFEKLREGVGE